jgi:hypothetical protein
MIAQVACSMPLLHPAAMINIQYVYRFATVDGVVRNALHADAAIIVRPGYVYDKTRLTPTREDP